ncbi:hypothetical protein HYPBUDRAFT_112745 [Hyphopichia burtonii NRRL Y-1933]|uniref:Ribosomal RNA-processing protein 43 n=1 Tax=Hyphopichia burtonii NRRL Y-1933 TaxID=984485 RepID=A0A1E4RF89_9ASCO|nr:hypothetical protein HYPBUDRAFT_112745 [Hyphopichia burtonii NRRL Y-1933]ODV65932.1 hypothetical protein HYPBUDRAFT_112745 [Hyphopichia burtonii NRRL Y-1933]
MSEVQKSRQMAFPPSVLARIAPDVSLQRHLAIGLRPSLRNFTEFKSLEISQGNLNSLGENSVIGSAVAKNGDTSVFCGITLGIVETSGASPEYTSIYPVVEILRGRSGAPTDEEMITSQKIYESILHANIIPSESLKITPGYEIRDEENKTSSILYPDTPENISILEDIPSFSGNKKSYSFVLYAHLKVFSRSGPIFDLCYNTLLSALTNVTLPSIYIGDTSDKIKVPVRSRGNFGHLSGGDNLYIDSNKSLFHALKLQKNEMGYSSSFGVLDEIKPKTVVLADPEGDAEESCITSKINVITNKSGDSLKHVSICGGGANVSIDVLKESIRLAQLRSLHN